MEESDAGSPVIVLPERLDRRMRLGPFPSSRDALKFVAYAASGALLVPFSSPWLWLPVVLGGFGIAVWRPDGRALDERLLVFVLWKFRSRTLGRRVTRANMCPLVRHGLLELSPHRFVAVVRLGGAPVAYLPPDELARRFELYRELLRSSDGHFAFLATTTPIRSQAVRPVTRTEGGRDSAALSGYSELVSVLCRRRLLRRVYFVVGASGGNPDTIGRLEGHIAGLVERLSSLGLRPARLRDRALSEAAHLFGWAAEVSRA
jgi:hypothetical protein